MSRRRERERYWAHSDPDTPNEQAPAKPTGPCPGICNRDWRKNERDHPNHGNTPVPGHPIWCEPCTRRIARSLLGLPEAFVQLELDKIGGTPNPAERGDGKKPVASAPPSSSPAADAQDELVRWLVEWEVMVRAYFALADRVPVLPRQSARVVDGSATARVFVAFTDGCLFLVAGSWPPRPRSITTMAARRESVTTMAAVKFLTIHLEQILADDRVATDFGKQVLQHASKLRRRTRLDEQRVRKPVPCPRCSLKCLVHEGGETYVACESPTCGRLLSMDEYDELQSEWLARTKPGKAVSA